MIERGSRSMTRVVFSAHLVKHGNCAPLPPRDRRPGQAGVKYGWTNPDNSRPLIRG